jgi:hypothetical protein
MATRRQSDPLMSWQVLTGVVEWWADEGLRDIGRRRYSAARGKRPTGDEMSPGHIDLARAAFAAQRNPWRLAEVSLSSVDDQVSPAIASWADNATAVLRGSPAQQRLVGPNETWGDLGLRRMLEPDALEALVPKPWPAEFQVPGDAVERDLTLMADFVSLSSDYYAVSYNRDLDVLTTWAAIIDGEIAQRVSLTHLTAVDSPAGPAPA